jgi:uncharacterized protein (DUF427 family)
MSTTSETSSTERGIHIEQGAKRIRAYLGGELVADTIRARLVWEVPYYPTYYFPVDDVRDELLSAEPGSVHSPSRGDATVMTVSAGGRQAPKAALRYEDSPIEALRDLVRLDWDAMDAWFEEDEEVFTHARNPYTRIDVLASSRHVRIELDGLTIAESTSLRLLFETGLPVRYYLPKPHVRMDLLELIDKVSHCPYKGTAQEFSVRAGERLHEKLAWSYPTPLRESERIAGLIAFYDEKLDIVVDGALQTRPATKFS